jgi:predicted ATPase/DNA-binding SARP family transcriptional activator
VTIELTLLARVAYRGTEITSRRLGGLLALLAGDLRTGASTARLVAGLWPEQQPENPTKAVQVLVSRARSQLGPDVIASTPTGYRLALGEDRVDASALLLSAAASVRHAAAGDHAAALAHAEAGLALWDGAAGQDAVADDPVLALRAERAPARRSLVRARALALARLGRPGEAVEALTELVRERPRDEEVLLELLRCEEATLGPSAALARYEAYRRSLRDELGTDPGPALQAVHQELLRGQAPVVRHGVAHEPNALLGRAGDLAAVADLLRRSRVVSVVGTGGLGKTRLAHAVSREAEQRVVHFVPLAGVGADDDVAGEVASALGAREGRHSPVAGPLGGIVEALGTGPVLLVLDNCEQVVRGAAELVHALVSMTRDLRVLTTSRAPLGLSSESVYPLPELDLTTTVELFTQRARAARPGADLPAPAVAEICRHLDGLPLAVELAAARIRIMSVAEITRDLADRFTLLRGGTRDAPERHRTLHAVVEWSWNLLEPAGQAAMRALSVFPGGFTPDAARHLLGRDVLPVVEQLVDQSLLKVVETPAGTRLRMLETVREFSAAHREAAGGTDSVVRGFLAWARDFGMATHEELFGAAPSGPGERVGAEQDNLMHALRQALAREDAGTVAAVSAVLAGLWTFESDYARLAALTGEAGWLLSHFRPEPELVEVTRTTAALFTVSAFVVQGPRAVRSLVTLRRLPEAPPDTLIRAAAIVLGAAPMILQPDRLALRALCDSPEPLVAGVANGIGSYVLEQDGDADGSLKAARRMLEAFEGSDVQWMRIMAHSRIGELCLQAELGEEARYHLGQALAMMTDLPWADVLGFQLGMVQANLQVGDVDEAERWLERTARNWTAERVGTRTYNLGIRAEIRLARGDVEAGLHLWRRAADTRENADDPVFRTDPPGLEPWNLEAQAATVVAHARHGRTDLVGDLVDELPRKVTMLLRYPAARPPVYFVEAPVCGALLLALAGVDLDRGATASGVRLTALAERFGFLHGFQPTMSTARARQAAEQADRAAYAEAVSAYAALDRDGLRAAALAALRHR